MIPPWIYSAPSTTDFFNVVPDTAKFDKKTIYITDARRVGIMLRGGRLTLRNHSAMTRFIVEAVGDTNFILQAPDAGKTSYVRLGDRNAFFADTTKEKAQKFEMQATEIGLELQLDGQRPAIFDYQFDVSIGKWETGLSPIVLLIHTDIATIWQSPGANQVEKYPGSSGPFNGGVQ